MRTENPETLTYKVKDLTLAEWGRKEIDLAEFEMPGLMSLRKKYGKEKFWSTPRGIFDAFVSDKRIAEIRWYPTPSNDKSFGFNQLKLHTIEAKVMANNRSALYLLNLLGFKKEAHFKDRIYFGGMYHDLLVCTLINPQD
jgi:hypothetical protein